MWPSNLHLPLCLSKRRTWPDFVNRKRGNIKAVEGGRGGKKNTDKAGGWGVGGLPPQSPASSLACLS